MDAEKNCLFTLPSLVYFSTQGVDLLADLVTKKSKRIFLIADPIHHESGVIAKIKKSLGARGGEAVLFDDLKSPPSLDKAQKARDLIRASHPGAVVGVGGIKTLTFAKHVAYGSQDRDPPPYIEVPTSCRNPFAFHSQLVLSDALSHKPVLQRSTPYPYAVFIDPELGSSLPEKYRITTLLDLLTYALEGLCRKDNSFLSETLILEALKELFSTLGKLPKIQNERSLIHRSYRAGFYLALGLAEKPVGLGAALAYALNSRYIIPKSLIFCFLLPHLLDYYISTIPQAFTKIRALFPGMPEESTAAQQLVEYTNTVLSNSQLPHRLTEIGIKITDLKEPARDALDLFHGFNPGQQIPEETVMELLKAIQ